MAVRREKETELNNARNNYETELKRQLAEAHKSIELNKSRQNNEMEITRIRRKYEEELTSKEEAKNEVCREYQERDQAWQLEKQVLFSHIFMTMVGIAQ